MDRRSSDFVSPGRSSWSRPIARRNSMRRRSRKGNRTSTHPTEEQYSQPTSRQADRMRPYLSLWPGLPGRRRQAHRERGLAGSSGGRRWARASPPQGIGFGFAHEYHAATGDARHPSKASRRKALGQRGPIASLRPRARRTEDVRRVQRVPTEPCCGLPRALGLRRRLSGGLEKQFPACSLRGGCFGGRKPDGRAAGLPRTLVVVERVPGSLRRGDATLLSLSAPRRGG